MIRGVTPIDTAFEIMGLHQAQAITRFIFMESLGGKLVFAAGFISSISAWLNKGSFRPLMVFLLMFFSLWFLLVLPRAKGADAISAMERSGYQEITALQVLKKNGYDDVWTNQMMGMTSSLIDSFVSGIVAVMDRMSGGKGYLASPFLFNKVSVLTSSIMAAGITDARLEQELANFYQDHFWPAVRKLGGNEDVWPGSSSVLALYKEEGRGEWAVLRERLYVFCDQQRIFTRMFERFYEGKVDKDSVVQELLEQEIDNKPQRYALVSYNSQKKSLGVLSQRAVKYRRDIEFPRDLFTALPFIQGGALFLLWSSFGIFLATAFVLRHMAPLVLFVGLLCSVKGWTFVWALLDKVSTAWYMASRHAGAVEMWQAPGVNLWTAAGAVVLAAVMSAGVLLALTGSKRSGV